MKANHKKSQGFESCEKPKRALTHITLIIAILISILSCGVKSESTKSSKQLKSQSGLDYSFENPKAWLELKELLANDLMSEKELGIIDCRSFESNSVNIEPRLIKKVRYVILGAGYSWYTYQINNDLCIKMGLFDELTETRPKPRPFFLNIEDTRFLLSASNSYHFKKLGLNQSKILLKKTYFQWGFVAICGGTSTRFLKDKNISSNNCYEEIIYKYEKKNRVN